MILEMRLMITSHPKATALCVISWGMALDMRFMKIRRFRTSAIAMRPV